MVDFNRRLNLACGRTAAVALVLALQAGTARAEIVLDSWSVIACTDIVQFVATFNCASNLHNPLRSDISSSTDPLPRTAQQSFQVGGSIISAHQSPGGWDSAGVRIAPDLELGRMATATARFEMEVHNTGPSPVPLDFRFLIFDGRLELVMTDFAATFQVPTSTVRARFFEGGGTSFWSYTGTLAGANSSFQPGYTSVLVDPQGIGGLSAVVSQALGAASVDLDTFGGRLDLGSIAAGQTRSFVYELFASVYNGVFFDNTGGSSTAPPPTVAGFAELKDPFDFGQGFFLNDIPLSQLTGDVGALAPVPEPQKWLLLAFALPAFVALRRRRLARENTNSRYT